MLHSNPSRDSSLDSARRPPLGGPDRVTGSAHSVCTFDPMARPVPMAKLPKGARVAKHQPARKAKPQAQLDAFADPTPPPGQSRWLCRPCNTVFTAYETVQRHMDDEHGGGRIELVLA